MVRKLLRGLNLLFLLLVIIPTFCSCTNEMNMLGWNNNEQINFSVSVPEWKNTNSLSSSRTSRATPITDTSFGADKSCNLIADQNDGTGDYTTLIDKEAVSFINNIWQTTPSHYYWSGTANKTINFYAYYPTSISGNISHTAGSVPTLLYTVPPDASNQIDIITATANNISGNTNSSTPLTFNHIFAAVKFRSGSLGLPSGNNTIIKIKGIQYKGIYTFNNGWVNSADIKDFYQNVNLSTFSVSTDITNDGTTFMMLPQTLSNATIEVTYNNGLVLSKTISGKWEANNIYTYNLSKSITCEYGYNGNYQTFTVPYTGTYKIECWGAQSSDVGYPSYGAYSEGMLALIKGDILYIYIGEMGTNGLTTGLYSSAGTFNGGGGYTGYPDYHCVTGGGATDIRLISGNWNDFNSLKSRIMVAAGAGGIIVGGNSNGGTLTSSDVITNYTDAAYTTADSKVSGSSQTSGYDFGIGQTSTRSGGGGGYYGGKAVQLSGAGGSSFISGYPGCDAIDKLSTSDNIIHTGLPNHYSGYVFTNSQMIAGNASMPSPAGGTEIGHSGNGYARITFVSAN